MCRFAVSEREPPLALGSVSVTLNEKSPNEPEGGPAVVTVSVVEEPPGVSVTLLEPKLDAASPGSPESANPIAGTPVVEDPAASVKVTW